MRLCDLLGHNVRIVCTNGLVIEGYVDIHVSAENNDPDPESIGICNDLDGVSYEIFEEDIASVEILDSKSK